MSESSLFDCLPFYPIHPVQQRLPPCLLMRRAKKRPLAGMVAIDRYRFPHVRTDMAKHNFLYNRHDMTLREPIERVDKERKGPGIRIYITLYGGCAIHSKSTLPVRRTLEESKVVVDSICVTFLLPTCPGSEEVSSVGSTDTFRTVLYLTSLDTMCSVSECEVRFEVRVGGRGSRDMYVISS